MDASDWRLRGQEDCLMGAELIHKSFKSDLPKVLMPDEDLRQYNDHEHCEFCFAKISENDEDLHEGYCTRDKYHWICPKCFEDFKNEFAWKLMR